MPLSADANPAAPPVAHPCGGSAHRPTGQQVSIGLLTPWRYQGDTASD